jgi:GWxTD domain-containing protein
MLGAGALIVVAGGAAWSDARAADEITRGYVQHAGRPGFGCEATAFLDGDSSFVSVRVEVPYPELSFCKLPEGGLGATFDLIVIALRENQPAGGDLWHERVVIPDRTALRGRRARYKRHLLLPLPPGRYVLEVAVSEPASGHEGRVRLALTIPIAAGEGPRLSPLLIGPCGRAGRIADLLGDPEVRTDFEDLPDSLCAYAELTHAGVRAGEVSVQWRLIPGTSDSGAVRGAFTLPAGNGRTRLAWGLPISRSLVASYQLLLECEIEGASAHAETQFGILGGAESALEPFFRDMLESLTYIAPESEVAELRMAAPADRRALWDAFWQRYDPTPETDRNEFKEEFFQRLRRANFEFSATRPGWKTDRGRVYIRHGEPDSIEREPYRPDGPPTETWTYDMSGLVFVFIDRAGFGEYVLVRGVP